MPIFVCDRCHCLENTALGLFNRRDKHAELLGQGYKDFEAVCSACAPETFADGTPIIKADGQLGKWHGVFPRKLATFQYLKTNNLEETDGYWDVVAGVEPVNTWEGTDNE